MSVKGRLDALCFRCLVRGLTSDEVGGFLSLRCGGNTVNQT